MKRKLSKGERNVSLPQAPHYLILSTKVLRAHDTCKTRWGNTSLVHEEQRTDAAGRKTAHAAAA